MSEVQFSISEFLMNGILVHGEIVTVETKVVGTNNMMIGECAVKASAFDDKGRAVESYIDVRLSAEQVKQGYHNALNNLKGKVVMLPIQPNIYKGQRDSYQQYNLAGLPLKPEQMKVS